MHASRNVLWVLAGALMLATLPLAATAQSQAPIEPELLSRLQADESSDFIVEMAERSDLSPAHRLGWEARGEYVWRALNEVAQRSQAGVLAYCQEQGLDCTSYVAANRVMVRAGALPAAKELASLPGVASLRLERSYQVPEALAGTGHGAQPALNSTALEATTTYTIPWGLLDTQADGVWAKGITGAGIKVATTATGVQWDHPALDQAFACADPADPACWHDPGAGCEGSVCDTNGMDTHLMGTMLGDHDPSLTYRAGMAPGAQWIACKGCPSTSCPEDTLLACGDWILAPDGNPANRPHLVLNGWGRAGGDDWYQATVQAWRASGIFPAFDVGNSGPSCGTLLSPGDYPESMDTTGHDEGRTILGNAGRGPSSFGHEPFTKPNLSAPGGGTCSSVPVDDWSCDWSFPVNASAHTAGAVALVWQACPILKGDIDGTMELLQSTADPPPAGDCGAPPDGEGNYTYGYGYLNVDRAVEQCTATGGAWTDYGPLCFDLYRFDGYYHPGTDKAYFLGGRLSTDTIASIYSFDPKTGACTATRDQLPVPVSNYTIVPVRDGKTLLLCTFGGRDATGAMISDVQCYDPVTHTAGLVTQLPRELSGYLIGSAAALNDKVYVFGGLQWDPANDATALTFEWDPGTDTWTQKGNLNLARGFIMSAVVDGQIYAFGGETFGAAGMQTESIAERFDPDKGVWSDIAVTDLPFASGEGRAYGFDSTSRTTVKGQVVIAGGGAAWPGHTAQGMVYDVASDSYDLTFRDLNVGRRLHAGFFDSESARLWVVGGYSSDPGYGRDEGPYGPAEYVDLITRVYLPVVLRSWAP